MGIKVKISELFSDPVVLYLLSDYTIELNDCEAMLLSKKASSKEEKLNAAREWNKQGPRDLK